MTDQVCTHGQTGVCVSKEELVSALRAMAQEQMDNEADVAPSAQGAYVHAWSMLRGLADRLEQPVGNDCVDSGGTNPVQSSPVTPSERGIVRMISVQAGSVYEDKIACGCGRWHHFVVHAVLPAESTAKKFELIPISELEVGDMFLTKDYEVAELTDIYEYRGSHYEISYKDENGKVWSGSFGYGAQVMTSSEPVQATALGDSPTQSEFSQRASGSEPFDLQRALDFQLHVVLGYSNKEHRDRITDAVLSVLRSTAFRQWAASKEDHSECDYYCSRGDCFVSLSSLLTELFGEVEG